MVERSSAHILYCHVPRHLHLHLDHSFVFILNYIEIECMSPLASAHIINFSVTFHYIALFLRMRNEFSRKNSHTHPHPYTYIIFYMFISPPLHTPCLWAFPFQLKTIWKFQKQYFCSPLSFINYYQMHDVVQFAKLCLRIVFNFAWIEKTPHKET